MTTTAYIHYPEGVDEDDTNRMSCSVKTVAVDPESEEPSIRKDVSNLNMHATYPNPYMESMLVELQKGNQRCDQRDVEASEELFRLPISNYTPHCPLSTQIRDAAQYNYEMIDYARKNMKPSCERSSTEFRPSIT